MGHGPGPDLTPRRLHEHIIHYVLGLPPYNRGRVRSLAEMVLLKAIDRMPARWNPLYP